MKTKEDLPPPEAPRDPAGKPVGPASPADEPAPRPAPDEEEMGGEAPCQLHRFWDGGEAE